MNKRSFFLKIIGAAVLVLVGFFLGLGAQERLSELKTPPSAPQATTGVETGLVSVMVDGSDILSFPGQVVQDNDTVWSVLKRLSETQGEKLKIESQDYGDMGILVTAINSVQGGEDNKYWQYWVNNEYGQVAADKQAVAGGDIIMWKFTGSKYEEIK